MEPSEVNVGLKCQCEALIRLTLVLRDRHRSFRSQYGALRGTKGSVLDLRGRKWAISNRCGTFRGRFVPSEASLRPSETSTGPENGSLRPSEADLGSQRLMRVLEARMGPSGVSVAPTPRSGNRMREPIQIHCNSSRINRIREVRAIDASVLPCI